MRRVRILEAAAEEAVEAAAWYERERPGLGKDFDSVLNLALDLLEDEIVPLVIMPSVAGAQGAMRLSLKRFPYYLVVRMQADEMIVVAIAHPDTDSLYIDLSDHSSVGSREVSEGVVLDYDASGQLVGIDIDQASRKVDLAQLVLSKLPGRVITDVA